MREAFNSMDSAGSGTLTTEDVSIIYNIHVHDITVKGILSRVCSIFHTEFIFFCEMYHLKIQNYGE